jgi:hypothetical protein
MKRPHIIHPCAIYAVESLRVAPGLSKSTIGRGVRLGRLRVTKRAGKYFLLGGWVLEWLRTGEVHRRMSSESHEEVKA